MPRPNFSDMLVERRRQLGLSVEQASRVLKIKEQVLIAFEEGDFSHIPKSGYAQGMLSSYARYLGMNPRVVVDAFCEDLFEYQNEGRTSHELRRRSRGTRASQGSGPSSSTPSMNPLIDRGQTRPVGSFSTTSQAHSTTNYLAGGRSPAPRRNPAAGQPAQRGDRQGYADEGYLIDGTDDMPRYNRRMPGTAASRRAGAEPRGTSAQRGGPADRTQVAPGRVTTPRADLSAAQVRRRGTAGGYGSDIITRDVSPHATDDLRYGQATSYEAASTRTGRRSSRNIASTDRPNVRRRNPQPQRSRPQRQQQPSGLVGSVRRFFSNPARAMAVVLAVLAVALTLIVISSVRSCATSATGGSHAVSVTAASSSASPASSTAAATSAANSAASAASTAATTQAITETDVKVAVGDGTVTWVEITNDGKSEVAETVTGPWEKSFVVTDSITIQVGSTSNVTVTRNGQTVAFESKASGVGSLTIQGTKVSATSGSAATTASATGASTTLDAEGSAATTSSSKKSG
ncbi:MAG: helix-turn-helix domain-containing protein [Atopobiaceae bacterium]|nr:helix-turn-helix domain-containing protein [Atopobiaceae bacterium]